MVDKDEVKRIVSLSRQGSLFISVIIIMLVGVQMGFSF